MRPSRRPPARSLTARGAAIRGIGNFASETVFGMRQTPAGELEPDWDALATFLRPARQEPVLLFGFTYIVWTRFLLEAERSRAAVSRPAGRASALRRLEEVDRRRPSPRRSLPGASAACSAARRGQILDFYGMVEQVGTVLVDCEAGHKHAPAFADFIIRRPGTLAPVDPGETGIIEILSTLPDQLSRPGPVDRRPGRAGGRGRLPLRTQGTATSVSPAASNRRRSAAAATSSPKPGTSHERAAYHTRKAS